MGNRVDSVIELTHLSPIDGEIAKLNIGAVPKSTQYATKYGVKISKGKTASLNLLAYLETVQKVTVSTAGAEIVNR